MGLWVGLIVRVGLSCSTECVIVRVRLCGCVVDCEDGIVGGDEC